MESAFVNEPLRSLFCSPIPFSGQKRSLSRSLSSTSGIDSPIERSEDVSAVSVFKTPITHNADIFVSRNSFQFIHKASITGQLQVTSRHYLCPRNVLFLIYFLGKNSLRSQ